MAGTDARKALKLWQDAGLLERDKARELSDYLAAHGPEAGGRRAVQIFSAIGAVLVGLGIILFVASHWDTMRPLFRGATLITGYALVVAFAGLASGKGYHNTSSALWFLATLTLGANIFLFGQMFNFSLTFWQGPLLWAVGALAMGYATRSSLHAWIVIALSTIAVGWMGGGSGWFTDDQWEFLARSTGLLPLLGLGWFSLGLLAGRTGQWRFAAGTWQVWGILLIAVPLLAGTLHEWVYVRVFRIEGLLKYSLVLAGVAALSAAAYARVEFATIRTRWFFVFVAILLFVMTIPVDTEPFDLLHRPAGFAPYVLLVFVLSLSLIWSGITAANTRLVNIGIGSTAFVILAQYFSWSFRLLDRSLAFVLGGIVLIVLSVVLEKQRRRILAEMAAREASG